MQSIGELLSEALAHDKAGRPADAERLCREILNVDTNHVGARLLLASIYQRRGTLDLATEHLTHILQHDPDHVAANYLLGITLAGQKKLDEAIARLENVARLAPSLADVPGLLAKLRAARLCAQGHALADGGDPRTAESRFREALQLNPNSTEALSCLGHVLLQQGRLSEAEQQARRAVELEPRLVEAHSNLAHVLIKLNRPEEAIQSFRRAIQLQPENAEFHTRYGLVLIQTGRFTEGWSESEWRWKRPGTQEAKPTRPVWTGEPLEGRTIVLATEQGLGDTIHFVRYAQSVKQRGGTVIVECRPQLVRLLATCPGVDQVVERGQPLPEYELIVPLVSLPRIFGTTLENVPAPIPYLSADDGLVAHWKRRLGDDYTCRVGIAWRGSPANVLDKERSIPLAQFAELASVPGVRLYSLQVGDGREELAGLEDRSAVVDFGEDIDKAHGPFMDTAAIMKNLDVVISCDSAVAHLAGALGVPVWVALAFSADWRWMVEREDTPWYPTMRLFRQQHPGEWADVFFRIKAALAQLASRKERSA